jgi:hypothetical protein
MASDRENDKDELPCPPSPPPPLLMCGLSYSAGTSSLADPNRRFSFLGRRGGAGATAAEGLELNIELGGVTRAVRV